MAQHTSPTAAMPQAWQPEQSPPPAIGLQPAADTQPAADVQPVADAWPAAPDPSPTGLGGNRLRPLEVAECSMCGVARPLGLLVPDGGSACDAIRWYCKDVKSCTERWVAARSSPAPARHPSPIWIVPGEAGSIASLGLPVAGAGGVIR
jgi:hypothetical protein